MQRIFAHNIIYDGQSYRHHVAQLDDATGTVTLFPFTEEIAGTCFYSGTIEVRVSDRRLEAYRPEGNVLLSHKRRSV